MEKTDPKEYKEVSKKIIDELLDQHPEWKHYEGQPNSWYDADSDTVKSYSDAVKGLMDKIPDELIKSNVGRWEKLAINARQAAETAANTGKSWGKKVNDEIIASLTTPDLQDYVIDLNNLENTPEQIQYWLGKEGPSAKLNSLWKSVRKNPTTTVPTNKKGGKIKKCDDGLKLPTFTKNFLFPSCQKPKDMVYYIS